MLATLAVILFLMPMTVGAQVINTVTSSENLTKSTTAYVGAVVVDGESGIKYIYSIILNGGTGPARVGAK